MRSPLCLNRRFCNFPVSGRLINTLFLVAAATAPKVFAPVAVATVLSMAAVPNPTAVFATVAAVAAAAPMDLYPVTAIVLLQPPKVLLGWRPLDQSVNSQGRLPGWRRRSPQLSSHTIPPNPTKYHPVESSHKLYLNQSFYLPHMVFVHHMKVCSTP
jgi:hypothetical protein